jgi:hypothetical protein
MLKSYSDGVGGVIQLIVVLVMVAGLLYFATVFINKDKYE